MQNIENDEFINNFKICDLREHVIKKGMWCGALTPINISNLIGLSEDDKVIEIKNNHTPALLKAIDEIIVNATDHVKECENNKPNKRVNKINISYENSVVTVYNNGQGIPIVKHKEKGLYIIQLIFSEFLSGTNIERKTNSIKGGINGLGAKLANTHSSLFTVETVNSKKKYTQVFRDRLKIIESPIIIDTNEDDYTKITFIPAYEELGYNNSYDYISDIDKWIRMRVYQISTYLGNKIEISYNNKLCEINNIEKFTNLIKNDDENFIFTSCKSQKDNEFNILYISIIIPSFGKKIKKSDQTISIINGVVSNKGSHINYIKKIIKSYLTNKCKKLTKGEEKLDISNNMRLIICGSIPNIDWSGQNKNELQVSDKIMDQYKIPDSFLNKLNTHLTSKVLVDKKEDIKVEHDKYFRAKNISKSNLKKHCILMVAEGDSAITLLRTGLTQKCNKKITNTFSPTFDWVGIISLQGVIINAAKEITLFNDNNIRSIKLKSNKRLNMLADAFGLKYNYKYDTKEEINSLNYGRLILCVDQDVDGTGKIASLVLVWLHTFWPNLLKNKLVGKLMTPVIRAYPKNKKNNLIEFHYENELTHQMTVDEDFLTKYNIKYFKGLATHSNDDAAIMFKIENFNKNIYIYAVDDITDELFNIYFGNDPSLRKKILISPVQYLTYEETEDLKLKQEIPIGKIQLNIDTKMYKHDAINRQLPHVIDGLNPARRKILMGSIIRFNSDAKEVKVFQLGGYIADKMLYHHGDASLNKTIIHMAQNFPGARKYPYLIGIGQFGSRHGDKAGSARYVSIKLSKIVNILFPQEDRWLLSYVSEEGTKAEPQYFVPILPMSVLESYQIVTEGWNFRGYSRSLNSVLKLIDLYLLGDKELIKLSDELYKTEKINDNIKKYSLDIDGDVRNYNDSTFAFGNYNYDKKNNIIYITDLPLGLSTISFLESLEKYKNNFIDKIEDYSSTIEIEINIYLKNNVIDIILNNFGNDIIDPIEDFLSLKTSLKANLNYYSCSKSVLEFEHEYVAAVLYWLPVRRDLYKKRIIRKIIINDVTIIKEEQIIKYINLSNKLNISNIEDEIIAEQILEQNGFIKIDINLLTSPGYEVNENLKDLLLNKSANYDYILNLRERDLTKSSLEKRKESLRKYLDERQVLKQYLDEQPFTAASLWKNEIDKLINIIN